MPSTSAPSPFRQLLVDYILQQANPPDKFSHQARVYALTQKIGDGTDYDDDVVFAAVWLHDLGVFIGHRPEELAALAAWNHIDYANAKAPALLQSLGFPAPKIPAVLEVIRTHMPSSNPGSYEGILVRDADILEQLGAVTILRTVSKVGRDTRFVLFSDALKVLRKNLETLPSQLRLEPARRLAEPRLVALRAFLEAADGEALGLDW